MPVRALILSLAGLLPVLFISGTPAIAMTDVLVVGNARGSVSFISEDSGKNLATIDVTYDREEVLSKMPAGGALIYNLMTADNGGAKDVDDVFLSPDGTVLYLSRGYLGDAVAMDLTRPGNPIIWRAPIGTHADHAAMSPDGRRLVISSSSDNKAFLLDTATGEEVGSFDTGTFSHQNDYSRDGRRIYNSSIGNVLLPRSLNALKGRRLLVIVDAETLEVEKSFAFEYGIRPNVFTDDEQVFYTQFSYQRGFSKIDLNTGEIVARVDLPASPYGQEHFAEPDDYPNDSAHHGMAMSGDGSRLCLAGTIDNYIAFASTETLEVTAISHGYALPYWATASSDGRLCYVSNSEEDTIAVMDFTTGKEVDRVPVGGFPQRTRIGRLADTVAKRLTEAAD